MYNFMQLTNQHRKPAVQSQIDLKAPVQADMACIIQNYLPAYLRYDINEQS